VQEVQASDLDSLQQFYAAYPDEFRAAATYKPSARRPAVKHWVAFAAAHDWTPTARIWLLADVQSLRARARLHAIWALTPALGRDIARVVAALL
jgi:hypothetical protein